MFHTFFFDVMKYMKLIISVKRIGMLYERFKPFELC